MADFCPMIMKNNKHCDGKLIPEGGHSTTAGSIFSNIDKNTITDYLVCEKCKTKVERAYIWKEVK